MSTPTIKVMRWPNRPSVPSFEQSTAYSAGYDLYAAIESSVRIMHGEKVTIPCGIAVEIPRGYVGLVRGRSGMAFNHNVTAFDGTIDADYRGEICCLLQFNGAKNSRDQYPSNYTVGPMSRIAQLVIVPYLNYKAEFVDSLSNTVRGQSGFGSTGL